MNDKIIKLINACHSDIDFNIANNCYYITINDFIGFDEEWGEIFRDYDNPEAINNLLDWLKNFCNFQVENFYTYYYFDTFEVCLGYTSYDI